MAIARLQVDPRTLLLPLCRKDGADPYKLARQIAMYGAAIDGMPSIEVTRGLDGRLRITDGVTRATRVATLQPGALVTVEVTEEFPDWDFSNLPTIGDVIP